MSSTSATCFSNSRNDQRAYPCGGVEHANAITLASTSPVTFGSTGGVRRFFRRIVAPTSPSRSAYALATLTTVWGSTPTRSAISRRPPDRPPASSSSNKILDRRTSCAGCAPVLTILINHSRSSALNTTDSNADLDTTRPHGRERKPPTTDLPHHRQILAATRY